MVNTENYRKGRYLDDEYQYILALCKEFNEETLGIIPDTSLYVFLAFSLNRSRANMAHYFSKRRDPPIYSALFKGLIRDQRVTSRLLPFRQKQSLLNVSSVEQVLSKFLAGQHIMRAFITQEFRIPFLDTVPIPPATRCYTRHG